MTDPIDPVELEPSDYPERQFDPIDPVAAAWEAYLRAVKASPLDREIFARHRDRIEAAIHESRAGGAEARVDGFQDGYRKGFDDGQLVQESRAGGGLDVARVKQAVTNIAVRHNVVKDPLAPNWSLMSLYGYSTTPANMDAEIAAEYAALSSPESKTK